MLLRARLLKDACVSATVHPYVCVSSEAEFIYQGQKGPKVSETNGHGLVLLFPPVVIVLRN